MCFTCPSISIQPGDTGTSWAIPNSFYFGIIRLFIGFYIFAILGYGLYTQHILEEPNGVVGSPWWTWWIYHSNWAWNLLGIYFICSSIQSFKKNTKIHFESVQQVRKEKSYWEIVSWILFEVSWNAAMFSFLGYWIFIKIVGCRYDKSLCRPLSFFSWNSHLVNIILINIDLLLNRIPFKPKHVLFSICFALLWLFFSIMWWISTDYWIYPIQNPKVSKWMAYSFYPGFIILYIILFVFGYFIEKLLNRLIVRRINREGYNLIRD